MTLIFYITMISENQVKKYCREDISLIENYDKAINDKTQTWDCHHRKESQYSVDELVDIGEYYNRPACELILLTKSEHMRLHHLGKEVSAETRQKLSEKKNGENNPMFGKHHSAEARKKMSKSKKGKHPSEESRKKLSEKKNGENNPMFGKHHSTETRKKIAEAKKGKPSGIKGTNWYNNGVKSIRAKTCPDGFVPGRIVCNKRV